MNLQESNAEYAEAIAGLTDKEREARLAVRETVIAALAILPGVALIGDYATGLTFAIRKLPTQSLREAIFKVVEKQLRDATFDTDGSWAEREAKRAAKLN